MNRLLPLASALALSACAVIPETQGPPAAATSVDAASAEARTLGALERIAELNPRLNAVIAVDPTAIEQARALDGRTAGGPLFGMPMLVKDNIEMAGPLATARRAR
jgi:amidase